MKKSLNAPKKEAQLWLSSSQTASPNGNNALYRHQMVHNLIRRFIHVTQWYFLQFNWLQFKLLAIVQLLIFIRYVLLCPYFSFFRFFCQQYFWSIFLVQCFWSIITSRDSRSSGLNFTSLAISPTIPIFTFCSYHCETSINAYPASENSFRRV